MTRDELLAEVKRKRLLEQVKAKRDQESSLQAPAQSTSDKARGLIQSVNKGSLMGFGDEIVGAGRAALDNILPDPGSQYLEGLDMKPNPGNDYAMYRDDERAVTKQFEQENPKSALAANLAGGFLSPVNKVAPGIGRSPGQALVRAAAEGATQGLGEGEGSAEEQLASARTGAAFGGGANLAFRGLGKALGATVFGRHVKSDLVQPDGTFKPIHLAEPDSLLGNLYRSTLGRIPGAKSRLQAQEQPFVDAAVNNLDTVTTQLDDEAARIQDSFTSLRQHARDTAEGLTDGSQARTQAEIDAIKEGADRTAADVSAKFRAHAAKEALPEHARSVLDDVDMDNPKAVRSALSGWWRKKGFEEVKSRSFDFDDTLKRNIQARIKEDPELRLALNDVVGDIKKMQGKLTDTQAPGTDLVPEDYIDAMLSGKFQIRGDALMAMRNVFATGANGSSRNGGALRQVANQFDNFIRGHLADESPALVKQFNDQIDRYTTALTYMDASRIKAARAAGGAFTPEHWMQASGKYGGKGMSDKAAPLEDVVIAGQQRVARAPQAARELSDAARMRGVTERKTINRTRLKQLRRLDKAKREAEQRIKNERKHGSLAQAQARVRELQHQTVPDTASGLSALLTASVAGDVLPGVTNNRAVKLGRGMAVGSALATPTAQKVIAGQTGWQQAAKAALVRGDMAEYNRIISRFAAGRAAGE